MSDVTLSADEFAMVLETLRECADIVYRGEADGYVVDSLRDAARVMAVHSDPWEYGVEFDREIQPITGPYDDREAALRIATNKYAAEGRWLVRRIAGTEEWERV